MSLNALKLLFPVLLFTLSITVSAQKTTSDVEVITFGSRDKTTKTALQSRDWVVKTNPMSFITGNQMIFVERRLSDYFTIEGGVGVTFKSVINLDDEFLEDALEIYPEAQLDNWGTGEYNYSESSIPNFKITPTLGRKLSISPRLYFEEESPEGWFMAIAFTHIRRNYNVPKVTETKYISNTYPTISTDNFQQNRTLNNLSLRLGGQFLFDKISLEFIMGAGVGYRTDSRLDVGIDKNRIWRNKTQEYKMTLPIFELGMRVGYGF